jgi:hypothetical protein
VTRRPLELDCLTQRGPLAIGTSGVLMSGRLLRNTECMLQLTDLRRGRARHAGPIAGVSVFVLVTCGGWLAWQLMQGDQGTLRQSQFETWLIGLAIGTTVVALLSAAF